MPKKIYDMSLLEQCFDDFLEIFGCEEAWYKKMAIFISRGN